MAQILKGAPVTEALTQRSIKEVEELKTQFPHFLPIFTKTTPESLTMLKQSFGYDAIYMGCGYFRDAHSNIDWDLMKQWRLSL